MNIAVAVSKIVGWTWAKACRPGGQAVARHLPGSPKAEGAICGSWTWNYFTNLSLPLASSFWSKTSKEFAEQRDSSRIREALFILC